MIHRVGAKMLVRYSQSLTRQFSALFHSSLLKHHGMSYSAPSLASPAAVVLGTAADVADVTGVYNDPPVSSTVKPATEPTLLQPRVVVYDGVCHLCHGEIFYVGEHDPKGYSDDQDCLSPIFKWDPNAFCLVGFQSGVKWVIRVDKHRKIKFCCLQSKAAEPYLRLCGLDREDVLRRFLFVEGPGLYHQASTAALRVLSYLPLPYSVLSTLLIIPRPLRDAVYDHVAKRRYDWFGKSEDCLVLQEKELLERFIDRDEMMDQN